MLNSKGKPRKRLYRSSWQDRFWWHTERADDDSCWLWKGHTCDGYGKLLIMETRKLRGAHQLSWEIHQGSIPPGLYVLHKCHVRHCVNPKHLYVGTQKQNVRDSINAGTHRYNLPWYP